MPDAYRDHANAIRCVGPSPVRSASQHLIECHEAEIVQLQAKIEALNSKITQLDRETTSTD